MDGNGNERGPRGPAQYRLQDAALACISIGREATTERKRGRYYDASKFLSNLHNSMRAAGSAADDQDKLQSLLKDYERSLVRGVSSDMKTSEDALLRAVEALNLWPQPVYTAEGGETLEAVTDKLAAQNYTWFTAAELRAYNQCRRDHISTPLRKDERLLVPPQPNWPARNAVAIASFLAVPGMGTAGPDAQATQTEQQQQQQQQLKMACQRACLHHRGWASIYCWIFYLIKVLTTLLGLATGASGVSSLKQVKDTTEWQIAAVVMSLVAAALNGLELTFRFQERQAKRQGFATRYSKLLLRLAPEHITDEQLKQVQIDKDQADEDASNDGMYLGTCQLWGAACTSPEAE